MRLVLVALMITTAHAVFKPADRAALKSAVDSCISESSTGDCTTLAGNNVLSGQGSGTYGAIGDWDVSLVTDMSSMFENAYGFNQDLSDWDVSSVTTMSSMFYDAYDFNNGGASGIGNWDVSGVTDMSSMFRKAHSFNQNIANWNVGAVTDFALFMYIAGTREDNSVSLVGKYSHDLSRWNIKAGLVQGKLIQMFKKQSQMPALCGSAWVEYHKWRTSGALIFQDVTTTHYTNWCTVVDQTTCATGSKDYCTPNDATGEGGSCTTDGCADCTGQTLVTDTGCVAPSETVCQDLTTPQHFCSSTTLCSSDCTDCSGTLALQSYQTCAVPSQSTCGSLTQKFCPANATAQASTCQANCAGCTGFTTEGPTCTYTPAEAACQADNGQKFCPADSTCVAAVAGCMSCMGYTAEAATCAEPSENTCQADSKNFCPSGASAQGDTCQDDCSTCGGYTVPGFTCQVDGTTIDETACVNNGQKFCPADGTCQNDCSGCTDYTVAGNTCQATGTPASQTSCVNNDQKFCPSGASAQSDTCQDDCTGCTGYTVEGNTCAINQCSAYSFPTGVVPGDSSGCTDGGTLAQGGTCALKCDTGYATGGSGTTLTCASGALNGAAATSDLTCTLLCTASTDSSKTGSDGEFYCINGGTIGGTIDSCECTSCNTGFEGTSCQTASACTASTDSNKDGSDGLFYCINGGSIGGTTGSCECTSCTNGFSGTHCNECAAGKGFDGTDACVDCAYPQHNNEVSHTAQCADRTCPAGEGVTGDSGWNTATGNCEACPTGKYSAANDNGVCVDQTTCGTQVGGATRLTGNSSEAAGTCAPCAAGSEHNDATGNCDTCASGKFKSGTAGTCSDWATCAAGEYISQAGTTTSDRGCTVCSSGTFTNEANQGSCTACSTCPPGQGRTDSGSCTTSSDTVCEDCNSGSKQEMYSAANDTTQCLDWSTCNAGEGRSDGTASTDATCAACVNQYQPDNGGTIACLDYKVCGNHYNGTTRLRHTGDPLTTAGDCEVCHAGSETATDNSDTENCVSIPCAANEYVSNKVCVACAAGKTRAAGDLRTGANTECCASDEIQSGLGCVDAACTHADVTDKQYQDLGCCAGC